jgi:hypothetical protein
MVTISKPLSSGQAQSYHKLEFTSESQNYWKQGETIQGEWQGQLTGKYGLEGAVDAVHFARLTEGRHPQTEQQLVRHRETHEYKNADGPRRNRSSTAPVGTRRSPLPSRSR